MNFNKKYLTTIVLIITIMCLVISGCSAQIENDTASIESAANDTFETELQAFEIINNNTPTFTDEEIQKAKNAIKNNTTYFQNDDEEYLPFDELGRCQTATGLLSTKTMPKDGEKRGNIGMIKPTGWHTVKYPEIISDLYLYNRCHLIGWQLGNENDNESNLITGTRFLNIEGMLPFENKTAEYIKNTNNHVLYKVTPDFKNDELVCRGVYIEARSIEDEDCIFYVYCNNIQPGIQIDYKTGESYAQNQDSKLKNDSNTKNYVLNANTLKIHTPECEYAQQISENNKIEYTGDIYELIENGYTTCNKCHPE